MWGFEVQGLGFGVKGVLVLSVGVYILEFSVSHVCLLFGIGYNREVAVAHFTGFREA